MDNIEYNIKIRKLYSAKLCEFYNYIKERVDNKGLFNFDVAGVIAEERKLFDKWQSKINKMESFNKDIVDVANGPNPFSDSKRREISHLKDSFEKQIKESYTHYLGFLNLLEKNRDLWLSEMIYEYITYSNKQKYLIELSNKIQIAYPNFKTICYQWNSESIDKAKSTLDAVSEIEMFCQTVLNEFDSLSVSSLPTQSQVQISVLAKQCEKLSELLENFFKNFNILDLLTRLKSEDSILFKNEFKEIFGSSGFGKIRTTIKLVYDTEATKVKIQIIYRTFKKLQLIIYPEMTKLSDKKNKLLSLCSDSSEINRISTEKWILENYVEIFGALDEIIQNPHPLES